MDVLFTLLNKINNFLWGFPLAALIVAVGIYYTVKTKLFQIKHLKTSFFYAFKKSQTQGISPFAAACTAISATVGTGNIAGVAGAIALGGPGVVFWMWITALLGMVIKLAETVLAVKYRRRDKNGFKGGPMYYITNGLPSTFKPLAFAFALFTILASLGSGNAVQVNTAAISVTSLFSSLKPNTIFAIRLILGIITALLVGAVLMGGATRISSATEALVPAMVVLYIVLAFGVIAVNIHNVPRAFITIFSSAFSPQSATAGVIGSFFMTFKTGMSRGIFTHEAGLGTSAMAHASANSASPTEQGFFGIFEVFVDTVAICTLTALAILCSGVQIPYGTDPGVNLTVSAFSTLYGSFAPAVLTVPIIFFAFTSVIGWGFYGIRCTEFLFGKKGVTIYLLLFCAVSAFSAVGNAERMWILSESCNLFMAFPNLTAIILLSPEVIKEIRIWEKSNIKP